MLELDRDEEHSEIGMPTGSRFFLLCGGQRQ
jgi:hypothetical protein